MRERSMFLILLTLAISSAAWYLAGCSEKEATLMPVDSEYHMDSEADCRGCHTNSDMLQATVDTTRDVTPPPSGEG